MIDTIATRCALVALSVDAVVLSLIKNNKLLEIVK